MFISNTDKVDGFCVYNWIEFGEGTLEKLMASDSQCECERVGLVCCLSKREAFYISLFIPVPRELKIMWKLDMVYQLALSIIPYRPPKKIGNKFIFPFPTHLKLHLARSDFAIPLMHLDRELG